MTEVKLPDNVSPALARFADVLCMYNLRVFCAELARLLEGSPNRLDERTIMYRLADHAVHVAAIETLEAQHRQADADALRSLPPITDRETARAARLLADGMAGKPIEHARGAALFAACDAADPQAPGRTAEHAAYAVAKTASCLPGDASRVYDAAVDLIKACAGDPELREHLH